MYEFKTTAWLAGLDDEILELDAYARGDCAWYGYEPDSLQRTVIEDPSLSADFVRVVWNTAVHSAVWASW